MTLSIEKIWDISYLVFESCNLAISFLDEKGDLRFEVPSPNQSKSPLHTKNLVDFRDIHRIETAHPIIVLKGIEQFLVQHVIIDGQFTGMLIIGPSLPFKLRDEQLKGLINDASALENHYKTMNDLKTIPVFNQDQLIGISLVLHYMLYEIRITRMEVSVKNFSVSSQTVLFENHEEILSQNRQLEQFHHDPSIEKHILRSIEKGDSEDFLYWNSKVPDDELGMLSRTSYLRSKKNLAISGIALATRAAIKGGLNSEIAFTLSDLYIQRIEETFLPERVDELLKEGMLAFINHVRKSQDQHYSDSVKKCLDYIYKNLYKTISLKDLVRHVNLNSSYLSDLFKREVGITISDYIHKAKIDEAIYLITTSERSLTEISNLLNFTDQSYFTRIFKKVTGTTPKKYQINKKPI